MLKTLIETCTNVVRFKSNMYKCILSYFFNVSPGWKRVSKIILLQTGHKVKALSCEL